jgi:hypothetical protein
VDLLLEDVLMVCDEHIFVVYFFEKQNTFLGLLAVSRALGDRPLAPHVCHTPDIFAVDSND